MVDSTIKRRFGSRARSRVWYVQFREVTVKAIVHNLERAVARSRRVIAQGFPTRPLGLVSAESDPRKTPTARGDLRARVLGL